MGKTPNGLAWIYSSTMFIFDTWSSSRMIQQAMMVKNHSLYWKYVNSQNLKVEALTGKHLQLFLVSPVVLSIAVAPLNLQSFSPKIMGQLMTNSYNPLLHSLASYRLKSMGSCSVPDSCISITIVGIHLLFHTLHPVLYNYLAR
jgi:hypothetical protein